MKKYQHKVQYYETDKMGIVHHSNYIRWMEEARIDFLSQIGWDFDKLEAEGLLSPVLSVDCKYRLSTMFPEVIDIDLWVESFKGFKLKIGYRMERDGAVVSEGTTEHCFMRPEGRLINIKREKPEFYNAMIAHIRE